MWPSLFYLQVFPSWKPNPHVHQYLNCHTGFSQKGSPSQDVVSLSMLFVCWGLVFWYVSILWTSLASAAKDWVSVKNTSFCSLDALFPTLMRGGWKCYLLFPSYASMLFLFTVVNDPRIWWVVSDCKRFAWWQAVPSMLFTRFF